MTDQAGVPCTFMRGGTSRGLFFRWEDVPDAPADRDRLLCAAIGSPDPHGRQLDGMGGGISSLSKAMMVRRSRRTGVDVDYLFGQIAVDKPMVDYSGNCGNLSAAVGAFAVDQGLVQLPDGPGVVRMFNENTAKCVDCHLSVNGGRAAVSGTQEIAGVADAGAPIRLDFLDPGGARTGRLYPDQGHTLSFRQSPPGVVAYSMIDAANPCVFVLAPDMGLLASELPDELLDRGDVLGLLERIRRHAGVAMGLAQTEDDVPDSVPKIALVGPPVASETLSGSEIRDGACDVQVRMISMGRPHLAIPLTGAMCAAVAARIPGTVVARYAGKVPAGQPLRIGTPSGVVPALANVVTDWTGPRAEFASVYRTARTLMEGTVMVRRQVLE